MLFLVGADFDLSAGVSENGEGEVGVYCEEAGGGVGVECFYVGYECAVCRSGPPKLPFNVAKFESDGDYGKDYEVIDYFPGGLARRLLRPLPVLPQRPRRSDEVRGQRFLRRLVELTVCGRVLEDME